MWLNTHASALTDTCILYTDGLTHRQTDTWMDRQADSSLPLKTFILPGYNKEMFTNMGTALFLFRWKKDLVKKNRLTLSQTSPGFYVSGIKAF